MSKKALEDIKVNLMNRTFHELKKRAKSKGYRSFEEYYAKLIFTDKASLNNLINKAIPTQTNNVNINLTEITLRDKESEVAKQLSKMQQSKRISTTYKVIKDQKDTPKDQSTGNTIPKQANE